MRASHVYFVTGLAALAVTAGASRADRLPKPEQPRLQGSAQTDYGRPVPLDPGVQATFAAAQADAFTARCVEASRMPRLPEYAPLLDAIAATRCERTGPGPQSITSYRFATARDLGEDFRTFRDSLSGADGACDGTSGITTWAGRDGKIAGGILCYTGTGDVFAVAWADDAQHTFHLASGRDTAEVLEWWQRVVRPQKSYPSAEEKRLLNLVGASVDTNACSRDDTGGSPMAQAAIVCDAVPHADRDTAKVHFELHTPRNLERYLRDRFSELEMLAIPEVDEPCATRAFERGTWKTLKRGTRGTLACFPTGDERVLIWTLDDAGLYGYLRGFGLDAPADLYEIWSRGLKAIDP